MIPYGRQDIVEADIEAVTNVLRSDYLTQGPLVPLFERKVAEKVGALHGVAVNSATSALHIACMALDLGEGDVLWTTPNTFVASANCGIYCGAEVDFVDIDARTYNISATALRNRLEEASAVNKLPTVVVAVHFAGQPCDMEAIGQLSLEYGFKIIEDASHAIGGKYRGEYIGCGRYSDVTVFSFHPVKIITTAEGGMAVTNDRSIAERMKLARSHGVTRSDTLMENASSEPWYYEQVDLGFNYRMTELQAALGVSQLNRLDEYVQRRHVLAEHYDSLLEGLTVVTPYRESDGYSGFHLYPVRIQGAKDRRAVFDSLRARGIGVNVHYIPVHTQPYYQHMGFKWGQFPEAESYYEEAISLPLYPGMEEEDVLLVTKALKESL